MRDDIRNVLRFLRREPALAAVVLATLAVGIGINTAIFSVLDAVVLRPLPFPKPDRLVAVWQQDRKDKSPFVVSAANFFDWQKQSAVFDSLAAVQQFQKRDYSVTAAGAPEPLKGVCISPELFKVLRVSPAIGRAFTSADAAPGRQPVVMLGHALWASRFGADAHVVGRELIVNGGKATVVGVMPAGFEVPLVDAAQIYLPLRLTPAERQERRIATLLVLGRLRDKLPVETASAHLDSVAAAFERAYPASNRDVGILLTPLADRVVGSLRPVLWAIFAAALCVLLLACLNLANVLGARGIRRQREFAIRASLGASRSRLARQLLTEGLVISTYGGIAALAAGAGMLRIFLGLFNNTIYFSLPRRGEIALDGRVLAFTAAACVATAVLFSIVPAWSAIRSNLQSLAGRSAGRWANRLRGALVVTEVGFSLALVVAAALLVRSYSRLQAQDRGFSTDGVLTATVVLPDARYSSGPQRAQFFARAVASVARIPGVISAAAVRYLPMSGVASMWSVSIPGRPSDNLPAAFHHVVSPAYFQTMRIPLLEGRGFDERDAAAGPPVAILSAAAARRYFPANAHPVGQRIRIEDERRAEWEVVGIVGDVRNLRPDLPPRPQIYVPGAQSPAAAMSLVVRSRQDAASLAPSLREAVAAIDPEQAVTEVKTLESVVADASARWRVSASLFLAFGIAAVAVASIGLYGVVAYSVAQRRTEIAIRLALGSSHRAVARMIVRSVGVAGAVGVGFGLLVAAAAGAAIRGLLYTVEPLDPPALAIPAAGFLALVLTIGAAAARKAARIAPSQALRAE